MSNFRINKLLILAFSFLISKNNSILSIILTNLFPCLSIQIKYSLYLDELINVNLQKFTLLMKINIGMLLITIIKKG
jgi:hypothetical protein